jgi:hypothetical protein
MDILRGKQIVWRVEVVLWASNFDPTVNFAPFGGFLGQIDPQNAVVS